MEPTPPGADPLEGHRGRSSCGRPPGGGGRSRSRGRGRTRRRGIPEGREGSRSLPRGSTSPFARSLPSPSTRASASPSGWVCGTSTVVRPQHGREFRSYLRPGLHGLADEVFLRVGISDTSKAGAARRFAARPARCVLYTHPIRVPQTPHLTPRSNQITSPKHPQRKPPCKPTNHQCSETAATIPYPPTPSSSPSASSASAPSPKSTNTSPQSTRPSGDAASPSSEPAKSTKSPSPPAAAPRSS